MADGRVILSLAIAFDCRFDATPPGSGIRRFKFQVSRYEMRVRD